MENDRLKVVIVDSVKDRREDIRQMLPDYADGFACGFGDDAYKSIKIGIDGRYPDLVIVDGDDEQLRGLQVFEWMRTKEPSLKKRFIPVLVLIEDEFSDAAMSFLEIDDVVFYEGELSEDKFFASFTEAADMLPTAMYEKTPEVSFESDKSAEKLMGKSVKAPVLPADKPQRVTVLSDSERLANLAKALERGRAQAEELRVLQAEIRGEKYVRKYTSHDRLYGETPDYYEEKTKPDRVAEILDEEDIPEEFRLGAAAKATAAATPATASSFTAPPVNPAPVKNTSGFITDVPRFEKKTTAIKNEQTANNNGKATIVVVDDHDFVRKMFEMALGEKYNVVSISSGMKGVDYFVKNKADLLFLDAVMPGLAGIQALNSIRWQENGKTVPCVFLAGNDYKGEASSLSGAYVCGTLPKPISKGAILTAVEQLKQYIDALK